MKMLLLGTAMAILFAPAWACGDGECGPADPGPGTDAPAPAPEPAPEPQPAPPARADRDGSPIETIGKQPRRPQPRPYSLAAISDQSYAPAKYTPLPQVCARTWWGGLRYSIPAGATKHGARDRCLRWLEGQ